MPVLVRSTRFGVLAVAISTEGLSLPASSLLHLTNTMPDHVLVVRQFTADEWPTYRDLRLSALHESPDAYGSIYAAECARADDEWASRLANGVSAPTVLPLVAEFDGEPSGLCWVRIEDTAPDVAHLYQMWVAPSCRRHGVGRALVDAAAAWAHAMGARHFELDVTCDNEAAVRLYEGAGFVVQGESRPLRPGSDLRAQKMSRGF